MVEVLANMRPRTESSIWPSEARFTFKTDQVREGSWTAPCQWPLQNFNGPLVIGVDALMFMSNTFVPRIGMRLLHSSLLKAALLCRGFIASMLCVTLSISEYQLVDLCPQW